MMLIGSPPVRPASPGPLSTPVPVTSDRGRELALPTGPPPPLEIDRVTLTPAARLELLIAGAEASLRDMDTLLEDVSWSARGPASIGMPYGAQLVPAVLAVGTAVGAAIDAANAAIPTEPSFPAQTERAASLAAHASASLQAASGRLTWLQGIAVGTVAGDVMPLTHCGDHDAKTAVAGQVGRSDDGGGANWIMTNPPDPRIVAAALAVMQETATRLASRARGVHVSSTALATRSRWRRDSGAMLVTKWKRRTPLLPGLFCLLVGLILVYQTDLKFMQHAAMVLAVLIGLAWCCRRIVWWHWQGRTGSGSDDQGEPRTQAAATPDRHRRMS